MEGFNWGICIIATAASASRWEKSFVFIYFIFLKAKVSWFSSHFNPAGFVSEGSLLAKTTLAALALVGYRVAGRPRLGCG